MKCNPKVSIDLVSYEYMSGHILVVHTVKLIPVKELARSHSQVFIVKNVICVTAFSFQQAGKGVAGVGGGCLWGGGMGLFSLIYSKYHQQTL